MNSSETLPPDAAVLAVDPGTGKCGVAVTSGSGDAQHLAIISTAELGAAVQALAQRYGVEVIVVGNRTGASEVARIVSAACPAARIVFVDEHMTTLRARERYFRDNPPRGLVRLLPRGLRGPPEPHDHYAALILAEDYLAGRSPQQPHPKTD